MDETQENAHTQGIKSLKKHLQRLRNDGRASQDHIVPQKMDFFQYKTARPRICVEEEDALRNWRALFNF